MIKYYHDPFARNCEVVFPMCDVGSVYDCLPDKFKSNNFVFVIGDYGKCTMEDLYTIAYSPKLNIVITRKVTNPVLAGIVQNRIRIPLLGQLARAGMLYSLGKYVRRVAIDKFRDFMNPNVRIPRGSTGSGGAQGSSQTYGWDGIQTLANTGIPVPVLYGEHALGGNLINVFTRNVDGKSIVYGLFALCEGPITEVCGITEDTDDADLEIIGNKLQIDNVAANEIEGLKVGVRMGNQQQSHFPQFNVLRDQFPLSTPILLARETVYEFTTENADVTELSVLFSHEGLVQFRQDNGDINSMNYLARIYYRETGSGDSWELLGEYLKRGATTSELTGEFNTADLETNPLNGKRYDIRVDQVTQNTDISRWITTTRLTAVIEGRDLQLSYPRTALLAVTVPAGEKVSGSLSNIRAVCKGRELLIIDAPGQSPYRAYSTNPIFCIADLVIDRIYGTGLFQEGTLNFNALLEEAEYLDSLGREMNTVVDYESPALDVINELGSNLQIDAFYDGTEISFRVRRDRPVKYIFNMSNIIKGSFTQVSNPISEIPNFIVIEYMDRNQNYDRNTYHLEDESQLIGGQGVVKLEIQARGMTDEKSVAKFANYLRKVALNVKQQVEFKSMVDGEYVFPGDIIALAHDVPGYTDISGRIYWASNTQIRFDKAIEVNLTEFPSPVFAVEMRDKNNNIVKAQINPIVPTGQTSVLFPPRYLFDFTSTIAENLENFDLYSLTILPDNENLSYGKLYLVERCERNAEGECTIFASEHFPEIYDDSIASFQPEPDTILPNPMLPARPVTNLTAYSAKSYYPVVSLSYSIPERIAGFGFFQKASAWWSTDGENFTFAGESRGERIEIRNLVPGQKYYFRVFAVNTLGGWNPGFTEIEHTPLPGITPKIKGLKLKDFTGMFFNTRDCEVVWDKASTLSEWGGAGNEALGAETGSLPEYIEGYEVSVFNPLSEILSYDGDTELNFRRRDFVDEEHYNYLYAMNQDDRTDIDTEEGVDLFNGPLRDIEISVRARDKFNRFGPPAVIRVRNNKAKLPELILASGESVEFKFSDRTVFSQIDYEDSFQIGYDEDNLDDDTYQLVTEDGFGYFFVSYNPNTSSDNEPDFEGYAIYAIETRPMGVDEFDGLPADFLGVFKPGHLNFGVSKRMLDKIKFRGTTFSQAGLIIIKPVDAFDVEVARNFIAATKALPMLNIQNCVQLEITRFIS